MSAEGWHPDPLGRYEFRYWNGTSWTGQVTNGDAVFTDDIDVGNLTTGSDAGARLRRSGPPPIEVETQPQATVEPYRSAPDPTPPDSQQFAPQPFTPPAQPAPFTQPAPHYHQQPPAQHLHYTQQTVYVQARKSMGLAFLLTFLFGPLGMLYSTVPGALVMLFLSVFLAFFTFGLSLFITWPICIIWGMAACRT